MTPGWHNVRNGLSANGHERPRMLWHNLLIILALGAAAWGIVVGIASVVMR
jgi:hypothetical protein